jgi:hypothetical protein
MPGGGGPNGPCPAPGRGDDDQSGAELYPPGTAGYLCGGDLMDAFVKLVAAGPLFWTWGGDWRSLKDYMHFSANGL